MKILNNKTIKQLFLALSILIGVFLVLSQLIIWNSYQTAAPVLLVLSLLTAVCVLAICLRYFHKQNKIIEAATEQMNYFLAGNTDARIACDDEGELYKLFHVVNTLAAVLNAHAENESQAKEFLKSTISDISHQLKTPLAALSIYNGLLQGEAEELPEIKEFASLSEKELDRIETLVQSLLKITKLDAGSIVIEKTCENLADMINEIELSFTYRAKQEQKEITLSGADDITLFCDHDWMIEAISNVVKNALDHTKPNEQIFIEWKQLAALTQITIKDTGNGIHSEDIHHIFKRFYRSRFSQDKQGIGLGLPLAKAIIEAHEGTITVDSILGQGSTFTISFLNPTKL
ncbi:MAG: HAMP domain-containing sensor histidine kinase [Anaerovoracaceae bacterium]